MPAIANQRRIPSTRWSQVLAGFWLVLVLAACAGRPVAPVSLRLTDLDGKTRIPALPAGTRAVVYVFLGVECPIANRCLPELAALEARLDPRGVRFVHVYPNPDETAEVVQKHRREYGLNPVAYRDPGLEIALALGAHATPEVVALTPEGGRIYRGRVNDQFLALGLGRPAPTRHDLAEALDAFLDGMPPGDRVTPAVGCTFRSIP